jgi:hypothetical protein
MDFCIQYASCLTYFNTDKIIHINFIIIHMVKQRSTMYRGKYGLRVSKCLKKGNKNKKSKLVKYYAFYMYWSMLWIDPN